MPFTPDSYKTITDWFRERKLEITDDILIKFEKYHDLILEWSEKMNLVSRNDLTRLVSRHFLDSLVPIDEIPKRGDLVDIGSGAGFPAIPISIVRPELTLTLIESTRKKTKFLEAVRDSLVLGNLKIYNCRLDDFKASRLFDIATVRGVAVNKKLMRQIAKILLNSGKVIYYNKIGEYTLIIPRG